MKRFLLSLGIATTVLALAPREADAASTRRVVVAGRQGDALTDRVQKELGAMGFAVVRVDAASGSSSLPACASAT